MKSQQEAIFNMFRTTQEVGNDNSVFINTIPELLAGFTALGARISNISGLISLQASVISGISVDKNDLKETMAKLTYNYSGPGRAWAAKNNDDQNYNAMNISISKIKQTPDDQAGPVCQNVHGLLNTNAVALVPFGLTAAMINELNTAITDYIAIVPLPANAVNTRQTYTTNLDERIKQTSEFLDRLLDNIVRGQINANPDFVTTYFNGREIIDAPVNSTTFKITVLESGINAPILGARAEALSTSRIAFTDVNGKCELKQFKKGTYTILVSAPGFNPSQQIVPIGLGETKELTFSLTRV